jgi:formamidopyrimidine-DNA glycosylase
LAVPELPDILVYIDALATRIVGQKLERVRLLNPFLLRTADPPISAAEGRRVTGLRRIGKRIVIAFEGGIFLVLHLMVAGRLQWRAVGSKPPGRIALAVLEFSSGSLMFTEAGTKRLASLHVVQGEDALHRFDPGGLEVLDADQAAFSSRLKSENHTLKRALTDRHIFSGIGNAYSDEILHRARLSPIVLTSQLADEQVARLYEAARAILTEWTQRLRRETGGAFPDKVTAFRDAMAVHGRHGQPCPVCGAPVQRIVYADNETNYCARCQTGGRILADRALSRLLKKSWPRNIDELE